MIPSNDTTLASAYASRKNWYTNRASAIFPVRLRSGGDLILTYLNYWSIKNKIENVQRILRLYSESGELTHRQSEKVSGSGAALSVTGIFSLAGNFDGMIEIEFISANNLRFAFPAVQAFYTDGNAISTVHSAGRCKNADEPQAFLKESVETNWNCKFSREITPFFHVFTNGTQCGPIGVQVEVFSPANTLLASLHIPALLEGSFSSRLVTLDSLFPELWGDEVPASGSFCKVKVSQTGIFPRLVVGNLHRPTNFLEVTHSYAQLPNKDYVLNARDTELSAFIPAIKPQEFDLCIVSFPTNSPADVQALVRVQKHGANRLETTCNSLSWRTGGEKAAVFNYTLEDDASMVSVDFRGQNIPARLNVNYLYSVKNSTSAYSTDISSAAAPCINPAKHTHWGTSVVGDGFETLLLARNISHNTSAGQMAHGTLTIWLDNGEVQTRTIMVDAESSAVWTIAQENKTGLTQRPAYTHWLANFDQPTVEITWVSYAKDGRICGDHSF